MGDSTTVRVNRFTHETLKGLARGRGTTVTETVTQAVRLLRQEQMGTELAQALDQHEVDWLDADLR